MITPEMIHEARVYALVHGDCQRLLAYVQTLEDMLYDMTGLTDWMRDGYTIDEYRAFGAMVEARRASESAPPMGAGKGVGDDE